MPPGVGHEADADEPGDERRRARRDADVARAREREPGACGRAVDGRDDRLLEAADEPDVRVVGLLERIAERPLELRELPQVLAGARSRVPRP